MSDPFSSDHILIVRHGPDRGRIGGYLQPFLDDLGVRQPALSARIMLHETGGAPPCLDGVGAVVFWLADPLRELYPGCYAEAVRIATEARLRGIRIVHPPDALSNTIKSAQQRLWSRAGIPTPPHYGFRDRAELEAILPRVEFPVMVRPDLLHAQTGVLLCASAAQVRALPEGALHYPGTLTPFVDTRAGFRATQPGSIWAEYFHKKRAFVFGDFVRTNHVFFSRQPIVGLASSTFNEWDRARWRNPARHLLGWWENRACLRADFTYWRQESEAPELLRRAAHTLGLECVAIDYSSLADGRLILWEANPYFHLHSWRTAVLRRQRRMKERIVSFYDTLQAFFLSLVPQSGFQRDAAARRAGREV